jgi:hypothetical protein
MENVKTYTKLPSENLKRIEHLGDLFVDQKLILDWILKNCSLKAWADSFNSGYAPVTSCCEYSNELSRSIILGKKYAPIQRSFVTQSESVQVTVGRTQSF